MNPIAIEANTQPAKCRSCQAPIEWAVMVPNGRRMPFNAPIVLVPNGNDPTVPVGAVLVDMDRTTSHFATCPDADRWRKNKPPKGAQAGRL